jgi:hypothetical protein
MNDVVGISNKGSAKNSQEALRLIQQWGIAFESKKSVVPIFFETYSNLKNRGVSFPPAETSSGITFDSVSRFPCLLNFSLPYVL